MLLSLLVLVKETGHFFLFQVWTELADGSGATNFITGMGGYLQSILFGYGGLRMYTDRIDFNCTPIPDTTGFTIRGAYVSTCLDIPIFMT